MPKKPKQEIISIEEDAAVPDPYGLERFMEEVNILELEGFYFCPNRKVVAGDNKPRSLQELYEQPVTITLSEYGQPGELAYKVLQATFLKLSEQGHDTEGTVLFSRRELAGLVGKTSFGGNQSDQIFTALMQLNGTRVSCAIKFKERKGKTWVKKARVVTFHLFPTVAFEGAPLGRFARCAVEVHSAIVQNFKNRHVSYFNFERMRGLDMVGMMLYKRFFRHLANVYRDGMDRNALKFEKDYEQVCATWLGLKPAKHRSVIERQLGKRLEALKNVRLLRECRIEERADGTGFKVVGYAGQGFFKDYDDIYRRALPSPAPRTGEPVPLLIVSEFHRELGRNVHEFAPKEVAYARELLCRYTPDEVKSLVAFALREAAQTNFDMQWFGALSLYEGRWLAQKKRRRATATRQHVVAACRFCNEHGYLEFADGSIGACPHDPEKVALVHAQKPVRGFHQA